LPSFVAAFNSTASNKYLFLIQIQGEISFTKELARENGRLVRETWGIINSKLSGNHKICTNVISSFKQKEENNQITPNIDLKFAHLLKNS